MAGEKKGKAYEALVFAALHDLVISKKLEGPLHWNITPKGMSIEPDFSTGDDPNFPTSVLLLTYSGSAKNSWSKVWRNLGELVECKTNLPNAPKVYCLTFGTMRVGLVQLQEKAFDCSVWINPNSHSWATELDDFVSNCVASFPKGKQAQTDFIRKELSMATKKIKLAFDQLKSLLIVMCRTKSTSLDAMWNDHRSRVLPPIRSPMNTTYRRGLAKLRLLPESTFPIIFSGKKLKPFTGDQVFVSLGILKRTVGEHLELADSEAIFARRHLSYDVLNSIQSKPLPAGMQVIRDQVLDLANLPIYIRRLSKLGSRLFDPGNVFDLLKQMNADPTLGEGQYVTTPKDVWAFRVILEGIRQASGNMRQAYGYAQMVVDIKAAAQNPSCKVWLKKEFLYDPSPLLASSEPVRRGLQDFLNRTRDGAISNGQLAIVSWVLATKLKSLQINWVGITTDLESSWDSNMLEARYLCHSDYEPLVDILLAAPLRHKAKRVVIPSAFSEMAGVTDSGVTTVITCANTVINWQSCSDAGRDHKKKELCGRGIGLRYHWNGTAFVRRPGVKKMILILDGTWRQADIAALMRAGWDEIYYPDEMDQLAKAIV